MEQFKCSECERGFSMEKALQQHIQHKHKTEEISEAPLQKASSNKKFAAVIAVTLAVFFGFTFFVFPALSNQPVTTTGIATGATQHQNLAPTARIGINLGEKAHDFTVSTTDGKIVSLSDFSKQGKPVVIEFMATWCPHCARDLGEVKNIYLEYSEKVEFLAISLDSREGASVLGNYKSKNGYPVTFAPGSPQILRDYAVSFTTTKYAIDGDGIIRFKSTGEQSADSWRTLFNSLTAS